MSDYLSMETKRTTLGRPPGKQFPDRLVIPCTTAFKRELMETASEAGQPAAAWARQAIQDRLDHVVRVELNGTEHLSPIDYDY